MDTTTLAQVGTFQAINKQTKEQTKQTNKQNFCKFVMKLNFDLQFRWRQD